MSLIHPSLTFGDVWHSLLSSLYYHGQPSAPRGQKIREFLGVTLKVLDGRYNIMQNDVRQLNYKFMVAEWLWIWFGLEDVKTIGHYNKSIIPFSDDGLKFNGAYGPQVVKQWPNIVGLLQRDLDSRQAVIQIYQTPEKPTKDVPCTLSVQFFVRDGRVHTIVCMRSSDIWLGLPYDFFNFSMLANILAAQLNVDVGPVTYHLGSSHLYERDWKKAETLLEGGHVTPTLKSPRLPGQPPSPLCEVLQQGFYDGRPTLDEPWATYAKLLTEPKTAALGILAELNDA